MLACIRCDGTPPNEQKTPRASIPARVYARLSVHASPPCRHRRKPSRPPALLASGYSARMMKASNSLARQKNAGYDPTEARCGPEIPADQAKLHPAPGPIGLLLPRSHGSGQERPPAAKGEAESAGRRDAVGGPAWYLPFA